MLVLASQFTATSRLCSRESGHGSGYASGSTGSETTVAGYGSLTEPGNLFVLMPILVRSIAAPIIFHVVAYSFLH